MKVKIKEFVHVDIKSKGIEFEIHNPGGEHLGDLRLTMTKLVWSPRKASKNVHSITWSKFIEWAESSTKK